jgi:putative phage-type endonuclease
MEQQRSKEWIDMRLGKFTASEIHKLLGVKGLGDTGNTYCFEKACEIVFGKDEDENFTSFDMQRGIELEPIAFRKFKELKEIDFIDVQETFFFPYSVDAGASPDGVVGVDAVLEIKCPRSNKFFKLLAKGSEAIDKEYVAQMQMQILCSNSKQAHFFNYIIFKGEEMWHEIIVPRDEVMINLIKERISQAVIIRDEYVNQLKINKQWK